MTYATPTPSDFKKRFPDFVPVTDALIAVVLAEAAAEVGEDWIERDRSPATLYLTAHLLSVEGEPSRTTSGMSTVATTGVMKRRKVGDVEVEFAGVSGDSGSGGSANGYGSTIYGQSYMRLLRRNFPAVAVV